MTTAVDAVVGVEAADAAVDSEVAVAEAEVAEEDAIPAAIWTI